MKKTVNPERIVRPDEYFNVDTVEINGKVNSHYHNFIEIEMVTEGCGTVIIEDESYNVKRGSLYLIAVPDIHGYPVAPKENLRVFKVSFNESVVKNGLVKQFLANPKSLIYEFSEEETVFLTEIFSKLNYYKSLNFSMSYEISVNLLEHIVLSVLNKSSDLNLATSLPGEIKSALKFINMNYTENIGLAEVAREACLSESYFSKKFQEYVGITFNKYLSELRLNCVKRLLINTEKSLEEIAAVSGINNASYLVRAFKRKYGVTPGEWRNKAKEKLNK